MSTIPGSSCAGTEINFEGVVEELRERLPRNSLLPGSVAAKRHNSRQMCPGVETMVTARMNSNMDDPLRKHDIGWCRGRVSGNTGPMETPVTGSATAGGTCRESSTEQPQGEEQEARGPMPPGCLRLRHPIAGTMRARHGSQPLLRHNNQQRLNNAASVEPQPSLVLPPGGMLFPDGSAYRLVTTEATDAESASPSAAMVAAAKAQERALPLLQVCAVRVAETTTVQAAAGGGGVGGGASVSL